MQNLQIGPDGKKTTLCTIKSEINSLNLRVFDSFIHRLYNIVKKRRRITNITTNKLALNNPQIIQTEDHQQIGKIFLNVRQKGRHTLPCFQFRAHLYHGEYGNNHPLPKQFPMSS